MSMKVIMGNGMAAISKIPRKSISKIQIRRWNTVTKYKNPVKTHDGFSKLIINQFSSQSSTDKNILQQPTQAKR